MSDVINRIQGFLNEATALEPNKAQMKTIEGWVRKKLGLSRDPTFKQSGKDFHAPITPDGAHGKLCKEYRLDLTLWDASNEARRPNILAAKVHLRWSYKSGGSNGDGVGTIYMDVDGKIIHEDF